LGTEAFFIFRSSSADAVTSRGEYPKKGRYT
jgi:hypothetical protein